MKLQIGDGVLGRDRQQPPPALSTPIDTGVRQRLLGRRRVELLGTAGQDGVRGQVGVLPQRAQHLAPRLGRQFVEAVEERQQPAVDEEFPGGGRSCRSELRVAACEASG
ncbi:hypothetical protein [Streptomyces sp. NPDC057740]|uniref:hypothetical protein n=1 Tax=Streptomyces sp. NPDC057740 TaxID=3346234 RepID=UPI0036BE0BFA